MNLATSILGATAVRGLRESAATPVLQVGSDKLTRGQLAQVECYNWHAARLLSNVFESLAVPNLKFVYENLPPAALALPNVGVVSLAVLGAAFEAKGIGGETPLESYVARHTNGNKLVTFYTIKHREAAAQARETTARKARKGQRRDQAHRIRVDRFTRTNDKA